MHVRCLDTRRYVFSVADTFESQQWQELCEQVAQTIAGVSQTEVEEPVPQPGQQNQNEKHREPMISGLVLTQGRERKEEGRKKEGRRRDNVGYWL